MKNPATLPLIALLCAAGAVHAGDAAMLACRALPDGAARLACYDAIPVGAGASASASATVVAAAAPAMPARPAPAPAPDADGAFGMAAERAAPPRSIASTIDGNFAGWGPNTQFKLTNGQVWRVADGSAADLPAVANPRVRIVRNLFGTLFLEIDGTNNSPKVRRTQ